ncbi:MAG: hypothetical protein HY926_04255, partial [Elusimicrobia bacterium]|nr:hypothetical protein [Elusimicrobiota bacterium]
YKNNKDDQLDIGFWEDLVARGEERRQGLREVYEKYKGIDPESVPERFEDYQAQFEKDHAFHKEQLAEAKRQSREQLSDSGPADAAKKLIDKVLEKIGFHAEIKTEPDAPATGKGRDMDSLREERLKTAAELDKAKKESAQLTGDQAAQFYKSKIEPLNKRLAELQGSEERLLAEPILESKLRQRAESAEGQMEGTPKPPEDWKGINHTAEAKLAELRKRNQAGPSDAPMKSLQDVLDQGYSATKDEFAQHIDELVRIANQDSGKGYVYRAANSQWLAGTILNNKIQSLGLVLKPKLAMRGSTNLGYEFYASAESSKIPGIKGHFAMENLPGQFMRIKAPEGVTLDMSGQQNWGHLATADSIEIYNFKTKQFVPLKSLGLENIRREFAADFTAKTGLTPDQVVGSMTAEWSYYKNFVSKPSSPDDVVRRQDFQKFSATTQIYLEYLKSLGFTP